MAGDGWQYYNWSLTKAPTSFDTRHRIIVQGVYDLPVGKGRRLLSNGGWLSHIAGGWNVAVIETLQSGPAVTFSFAGSPNRYLPGPSRPNQLVPNDQVMVPDWSIGPNRFPQSAQNPLYNIGAFAYPAQFASGSPGGGAARGLWLLWPQYSLSKGWAIERSRFTLRVDANTLPTRLMATTPDTTVNISSPVTFGKFGPQTSCSYSAMGAYNGQIIISGRFEF